MNIVEFYIMFYYFLTPLPNFPGFPTVLAFTASSAPVTYGDGMSKPPFIHLCHNWGIMNS